MCFFAKLDVLFIFIQFKHIGYSVYDQSSLLMRLTISFHFFAAVCVYVFVLCVRQIVSVRRCGGFIGAGGLGKVLLP